MLTHFTWMLLKKVHYVYQILISAEQQLNPHIRYAWCTFFQTHADKYARAVKTTFFWLFCFMMVLHFFSILILSELTLKMWICLCWQHIQQVHIFWSLQLWPQRRSFWNHIYTAAYSRSLYNGKSENAEQGDKKCATQCLVDASFIRFPSKYIRDTWNRNNAPEGLQTIYQ